jgi:meso-butanediol dehydrogenase / (S,S)-butanediol dehydrogenase / diacetyl reductase
VDGLVQGQRALVTGGGRGIGRAICLELARHGAEVAVADINLDSAVAVASELKGQGHTAIGIGGDVGTPAGRMAIFEETHAQLGPVDILVNNAGIQQIVDPFELTDADWDRMMAINAKAVYFMSQQALVGMIARKRGAIVNLASAAGKLAVTPVTPHYNASKAAVIAITKTWARIAAPHGVRVNCVCPGMIDTEMWGMIDREWGGMMGKQQGETWEERIKQVPMGRGGTPEDVARVITFLASDMAGYMTGQAINVTGGWVTF